MSAIAEQIDLKEVKLVIWDLDETFWSGTLSEEGIQPIWANVELVKMLNDFGVVSSICSKNDFQSARAALDELGAWQEFVFPSINWEPKGQRIASIVSDINLRPNNVLFIDDNHGNLMEAKHYCPGLMTAYPDALPGIGVQLKQRAQKGVDRTRYEQYRALENKVTASKTASSNEEFLKNCNIEVTIERCSRDSLDRIYELVHRTNQLNFTKLRSSLEELKTLVEDPHYETALVRVRDKYGDYGTIGFYAVKGPTLTHFAFSCRCLGMGVEQYIYAKLNFPDFPKVAGETAVRLVRGLTPSHFVTTTGKAQVQQFEAEYVTTTRKILFKGPCDILQITSLIKGAANVATEVTYTSPKIGQAFGYSHSITIVNSLKQEYSAEEFCADNKMYGTTLFSGVYDEIFLSLLVDPGMGIYRKRSDGTLYAFGDYTNPLTDRSHWGRYVSGSHSPYIRFSIEFLERVEADFEFLGLIPTHMFQENLREIRSKLGKKTRLHLITGNEIPFPENAKMGNEDAHHRNAVYNAVLREFAASHENTFVFETNKFVLSTADLSGHQNHFTRQAAFRLAAGIQAVLAESQATVALRTKKEIRNYQLKKFCLDLLPSHSRPFIIRANDYLKKLFKSSRSIR